jgi:hypothetical protein
MSEGLIDALWYLARGVGAPRPGALLAAPGSRLAARGSR